MKKRFTPVFKIVFRKVYSPFNVTGENTLFKKELIRKQRRQNSSWKNKKVRSQHSKNIKYTKNYSTLPYATKYIKKDIENEEFDDEYDYLENA